MNVKEKRAKRRQNFKRFGRLNSKKIAELKEKNTPYEMAMFFPYLPTRSKNMDERHTISSFKTMIKKYRYCYSLDKNCTAKIKRKFLRTTEEECIEIDNNVYVFSNIGPYSFEEDGNWNLLFDKKVYLVLKNAGGLELKYVLQSIKKRVAANEYNNLEAWISSIDILSLNSQFPDNITISKSLFNELKWKIALYGKNIYKYEKGITYGELPNITFKRTRIENSYSLLKHYDKYNIAVTYSNSFFKNIKEVIGINSRVAVNKHIYDFLNKYYKEDSLGKISVDMLFNQQNEINSNALEYLNGIRENYIFLLDPYSKDYRAFFSKKRKHYSLFKTQQIMRKLKKEYKFVEVKLKEIENQMKEIKNHMHEIETMINTYNQDLGSNGLANHGFGFYGDGWDLDDDEDLAAEIRLETKWQLEQEEREREWERYEYEYALEESEYWSNNSYEEDNHKEKNNNSNENDEIPF